MKYVMLIYQGTALERQAALPEEERKQVYADYQGINQTPGVTPGVPMGLPENATTVRVEGGRTLTTDGPFVGMKEAVGGLFVLEAEDLDAAIEEWGRVLATLIGFLGDFDLAEEAAQEAFAEAADRWPRDGVPSNPRAWLMTTARNRATDRIRRDRALTTKFGLLVT